MDENTKLYFENSVDNNLDMVIKKTNGDEWIFTIRERNHNKNLLLELINEAVFCLDNKSDYQYLWTDSSGNETYTYKILVGNDLKVFFNSQLMDTFEISKSDFISLLITFTHDHKKEWINNLLPNKATVTEEMFSISKILYNKWEDEIIKALLKAENLLATT